MGSTGINLLDWKNPSIKTLHFAWMAFFITFVMWFGLGPLAAFIKTEFALTEPQWKALLMLNVAITIPSRILIGMLVLSMARSLFGQYQGGARRLSLLLGMLVLIQWAAGTVNVLLLAPLWMQVLHLFLADSVWITLVLTAASVLSVVTEVE